MKSFKQIKNTKGITLIALVVTIVVLLILAAVSISMLTGKNGIITQAQDSKDKTEQAKCEELVTVAINGLIAENSGDRSKITPEKIAEQVNKENNRDDVTAEGSTFPTNIIFNEEGRKVGVDIELGVTEEIKEEIYSADVSEEDIAPTDIFLYEIIEGTGETASIEWDNLPTKEARIIGMNPKYCTGGFRTETGEIYENTNYEIVLENGTKISDTLVVPYQVEIEGEMYKITEACIDAYGIYDNGIEYLLPKVKTIIYPNTIKKISGGSRINCDNDVLNKVVLPKELEVIGYNAFHNCRNLTSIEIPSSVTSIGDSVFKGTLWYNNQPEGEIYLGKVFYEYKGTMPENTSIIIKEGTTSIAGSAFYNCSSLTNINIPNSVTSIGNSAFYNCSSLTNIEIPSSVMSIGEEAFYRCTSLTSITIPSSVTSIGGRAFGFCDSLTTVNYRGSQEEWNQISIDSGNTYLTNATINFNYTGE